MDPNFFNATLSAIARGDDLAESTWQRLLHILIDDFAVDNTSVDIPEKFHNLLTAIHASEINGIAVNRQFVGIIEPVPKYRPFPIFVQYRIRGLDHPNQTGGLLEFFLPRTKWTVITRNSVICTIERGTPTQAKPCGGNGQTEVGGEQPTPKSTKHGSGRRTRLDNPSAVSSEATASNQVD